MQARRRLGRLSIPRPGPRSTNVTTAAGPAGRERRRRPSPITNVGIPYDPDAAGSAGTMAVVTPRRQIRRREAAVQRLLLLSRSRRWRRPVLILRVGGDMTSPIMVVVATRLLPPRPRRRGVLPRRIRTLGPLRIVLLLLLLLFLRITLL